MLDVLDATVLYKVGNVIILYSYVAVRKRMRAFSSEEDLMFPQM